MKNSQIQNRHHDPTLFFIGMFVFFTLGWQLFFYFPLIFILPFLLFPLIGNWQEPEPYDPWYEDGAWREVWYAMEKRKRKPKNDDYIAD